MNHRGWIGSSVLLATVAAPRVGLGGWKYSSLQESNAASARQPEPIESVTMAVASEREHRDTTTSIGTVLALRSVTLRNELAGTVREVALTPGQIVETGTVLVALDVSVEEAELKAGAARWDRHDLRKRKLSIAVKITRKTDLRCPGDCQIPGSVDPPDVDFAN
jgi:membrane fusion protein (multidrug efflux system)